MIQLARSLCVFAAVAIAFFSSQAAFAAVRGDADGDGGVSAADVELLADFLLGNGPPPTSSCLADANHDGTIGVADVVFLVNYLAGEGAAPDPLAETCNALDDDCDGTVNNGVSGCFLMRPGEAPLPAQDDSAYETQIRAIDFYFLFDRSGGSTTELTAMRSNLAAIGSAVVCPPNGTGAPGRCFKDAWWGYGGFGYTNTDPFRHYADMQATFPNLSGIVPVTTGSTYEPTNAALYMTATGAGSASIPGCSISSVNARTTCNNSPAGSNSFGYPCFRSGAEPYVFLFSDEAPASGSQVYACPTFQTVVAPQFLSRRMRLVGFYHTPSDSQAINDLRSYATATGTVGASNEPLVFSADGAAAPAAVQTALLTIADLHRMTLSASVEDTAGDAVDVEAAFVDRIEVLQGTENCSSGLTTTDGDGDGFADSFYATPGAPLCWRLVLKNNITVPSTGSPRSFPATIRITGNGETTISEREVTFIVP